MSFGSYWHERALATEAEVERLRAEKIEQEQEWAALLATLQACVDVQAAEIKRLRAVIVRAKDALLDGQSTQRVHNLLVDALHD